jgi:hypothetical protein
MAWKIIPFTVSADEVVDIHRINTNFLVVVEEVTGGLNEHNWAEDAFTDRDLLAEDVALRIKSNQMGASTDPTSPTSGTDVEFGQEWHAIAPNLDYTLVTKGGLIWLMASFQFDTDLMWGVNFAIELDGNVLGDSLLGSGDSSNDLITLWGGSVYAPAGTSDIAAPALWGGGGVDSQGGFGVVVSAMVELPAGSYTFRTVVRNVRRTLDISRSHNSMHVTNAELILLEMN